MSIIHRKSGITLIEVILAIIVFGIGVIVVMGTITSNIGRLYDVRNKDTAIMLAKEGMDMVYHIRDSNEERNALRDCAQVNSASTDACDNRFYEGSPTDDVTHFTIAIDVSPGGIYQMNEIDTGDSFVAQDDDDTQIYYHTGTLGGTPGFPGFWYDHDAGGRDTGFRRWISIRPVSGAEYSTAAARGSILEISSNVQYIRRGQPRTVTLQSFIGDIR